MPDHYRILGLSRLASPEEIKQAYFQAAKRTHPDSRIGSSIGEDFLLVQHAYDILSDPVKRSGYDLTIPGELDNYILITPQYSRKFLSQISEPQLIYSLLEISCRFNPANNPVPNLFICLVIDKSTSMSGSRIENVKGNIRTFLKQLDDQDILSIVTFSDRAEVLLAPMKVSEIRKNEYQILTIQTEGGTEIYKGLLEGIQQIRNYPNWTSSKHLILMTDGHTYGDENACLELATQASLENIMISAMGFGHEWNDRFLDQLVSPGGGSTIYVTSKKDIQKFLEYDLRIMKSVVARSIKIHYETGDDVDLRYAFRLSPITNPLQVNSPINLGNLSVAQKILVGFEFLVGKTNEKSMINISTGEIVMDIPGEAGLRRFPFDFMLPVNSQDSTSLPSKAIADVVMQMNLYRLQEKARGEVNAGKSLAAVSHLKYLATRLLSNGETALAHDVMNEADYIQQNLSYSIHGEKQIKYGTRGLYLPSGKGEEYQ